MEESNRIKISLMHIKDLAEVQAIERQSFATPWSFYAFVSELLDNDNSHYLVARIDEKIIGYIGVWIILDEGHITNVAVDPAYRKRGVAKALFAEVTKFVCTRGVTKMTLEVRVSNKVAKGLYEKLGYACLGIRPKYYRDNNEDAFIMWKDLTTNENHTWVNTRN